MGTIWAVWPTMQPPTVSTILLIFSGDWYTSKPKEKKNYKKAVVERECVWLVGFLSAHCESGWYGVGWAEIAVRMVVRLGFIVSGKTEELGESELWEQITKERCNKRY